MKELNVNVEWDGTVGSIGETEFMDNAPKGLSNDTFKDVDNYRQKFAASVAATVGEYANSTGYDEGPFSVNELSLGGDTLLSIVSSMEDDLLVTISTDITDTLKDTIDKYTTHAE